MKAGPVVRSLLVIALVLVVQVSLLDLVTIGGAHPDAMMVLAAAGGYWAGPERGARFGFVTGLAIDLLLPTPFGLTALVGCLVGYLTGTATAGLVRGSRWLPPVVLAAATAAGISGYAVVGTVLGQSDLVGAYLPAALAVAVPAAVVLALPELRLVRWALPAPAPSAAAASTGTSR